MQRQLQQFFRTVGVQIVSYNSDKSCFPRCCAAATQRLDIARYHSISSDQEKGCAGHDCKRRMCSNTGQELIFRQLLDYRSYTYTYLLADPVSRHAVIIDPVIDMVDRDVALVRDLGLDLKFGVNTHVHADHITGTGEIKRRLPACKSVIAAVSKAKADVHIKEGDRINFGPFSLECYSTPGHTDGCMSYVLRSQSMVFTGDALLIRGCGRTDFQQGDAGKLYDSVHAKILSLPLHFKLFPGHDYTGQMMSTVGEELKYNQRLTRPRNEFIEIMKNLKLPYPKQIDKALPANMVCGVYDADTPASQ